MIFPYFCHPVILLNMSFFSLCLVVNSYLLVSYSGASGIQQDGAKVENRPLSLLPIWLCIPSRSESLV